MPGQPIDSGSPRRKPYNALKASQSALAGKQVAPQARGPTFGYGVTPQTDPTYLGILARALQDLPRFEGASTLRDVSGRDLPIGRESGIELHAPGIFGGQWRYREVYQGPPVKNGEVGTIDFGGRDTAHRHLSVEPRGPRASPDDMTHFKSRLTRYGPFTDATMAITDPSGVAKVYGPADTLQKRGFGSEQIAYEPGYWRPNRGAAPMASALYTPPKAPRR